MSTDHPSRKSVWGVDRTVSRSVLVVLGALTTHQVGCPPPAAIFYRASDEVVLSLDASDIDELEVYWEAGVVQVTVDPNATQIEVTATRHVTSPGSQDSAEATLDDIRLSLAVSVENPRTVELLYEIVLDGCPGNCFADVEMVLPRGFDLLIRSEAGGVIVAGNEGLTDINVSFGAVQVTDQVGDVVIIVGNGAVEVAGRAGDVQVETEFGAIDIEAEPEAGGSIVATSGNGAISILVPSDFAAVVLLDTAFGAVDVELGDADTSGVEVQANHYSGTLNGGGGRIEAATDFGMVTLELSDG